MLCIWNLVVVVIFIYFFKCFISFWQRERERERDREWAGERQREGDTESKAGCRLWAVNTEPDVGLELTDGETMTWAEVRHSTDWATQAPGVVVIFKTQILSTFCTDWRLYVSDRHRSCGSISSGSYFLCSICWWWNVSYSTGHKYSKHYSQKLKESRPYWNGIIHSLQRSLTWLIPRGSLKFK